MFKFVVFVAIICSAFFLSPFKSNASVYPERPKEFNPKFEVAGCFIEYQNKLLFLHRQDTARQGNTWGIPGGKLEKNETPEQAIVREVGEETGLDISQEPVEYLDKVYFKYPDYDYVFHMMKVKISEKPEGIKLSLREHKGFTWVTIEDALSMKLMPCEDVLLKSYKKSKTS